MPAMNDSGVGIDIVEIERIRLALERFPRFVQRIFSPAERAEARTRNAPWRYLAGRFAAKEAVAKALGRSFAWQEVEVVGEPGGPPRANLHGRAREAARGLQLSLSISHCRDYAVAAAVVTRAPSGRLESAIA